MIVRDRLMAMSKDVPSGVRSLLKTVNLIPALTNSCKTHIVMKI